MSKIFLAVIFSYYSLISVEVEYPDLGGIVDFSKPESISNRLFILTNPKSGTHLLTYSIMSLTNRPTRGRLPIWHFYNDPNCFKIGNILDCNLDFTKPTTYYGHEYHLLRPLNRNKNKLLFTLRNFKENVLSDVLIKYGLGSIETDPKRVEKYFKREVLQNRSVFQEYIIRLQLFDDWNRKHRLLIPFEDLVHHPEKFVPKLLKFIGDEVDSTDFIENYSQFKKDLRIAYDRTQASTGSDSNTKYFSRFISLKTLNQVDKFVKCSYPDLWGKYLKQFAEEKN